MKTLQSIKIENKGRGVYRLTLNRPDIHNAFDDHCIAEISSSLSQLENEGDLRLLVLQGSGKSFSAGADLNWMRQMVDYGREENYADSWELACLMQKLNEFPRPTIASVHGAAMGGAVGLIACCDIAIADESAKFALSEASLGLAPAVISPYVIEAIGVRAARRYFLTAERFGAGEALQLGLLHQVCAEGQLDTELESIINQLLARGPQAQVACKCLIRKVAASRDADKLRKQTAELIADLRVSDEGQEGLQAFFDKRPPNWVGK